MAIKSSVETDSDYTILTTQEERDHRRQASLNLFRGYLLPNKSQDILGKLGYSQEQQKYIFPSVNYLGLGGQKLSGKGLEARPSTDSTGTGPASLVESPVKGVAEFQVTLPANIAWHARDRLTDSEIRSLKDINALMRLAIVDTELLGDGNDESLTYALHSGDHFPRFGLRPNSFFSRLAMTAGQATVFESKRLNETDVQMNITSRGVAPVAEVWRELTSMDSGLHVFGRVPQIRS